MLTGSRRFSVHVIMVASRNPWLRLETKAWWTETGFRDSRPTKSRLETTWSRLETGLETPEIATRKQHTRDQNVILRDLPVATRDRVFSSRDHPCLDWAAYVLLGHDLLGYLLTGLHVFLLLFVCENVRAGPITQLFECMHAKCVYTCLLYVITCTPTWPIFGNHARTWWPTWLTGYLIYRATQGEFTT